ncbi:MAG: sigma-54 interaction domain-containing protein [Pirellulales bacterium]
MPDDPRSAGIQSALSSFRQSPQLATVAAEFCLSAALAEDVPRLLADALPVLAKAASAEYLAVAAGNRGEWSTLGEFGSTRPLPADLLANALDAEQAQRRQPWIAVPLRAGTNSEVLAGSVSAMTAGPAAEATLSALAPVLGQAIAAVRGRQADRRRAKRLEAILEISSQWYLVHEMEPLLTRMAEAATKLLRADRASIFLWDRKSRTLVGRPALGVEGNELRIPENTGIVGQVVQSGRPRRIDLAADQEEIDRQVDKKLGYQTKTILCVPLHGRNGELFGAFEVINKLSGNFSDDDEATLIELAAHAAVALENTQERALLMESRRVMTEQAAQRVSLIGNSPRVEALRSTIGRVAKTDLAVLVLGENGTGKEVISQMVHYLSPRRDQPFVAVNCAAISETLLESELFGHEKGAFTDAHDTRPGKFEVASGGTLFLDEIGDLSLGGQAKLLRVLEQKEVVRVGGSTPIHTDARVIAATNQDLAAMVREKRFRQDLYFRLNVVVLESPPLRERADDILLLAGHFLEDFCKRARRKTLEISPAAQRRLESHNWPGNVRELRNLMERLAYLSASDRIEVDDLAFVLSSSPSEAPAWVAADLPLAEATDTFQSEYIKKAIARIGGNMSEAAKSLGLHRSNLYRKMRQLGMQVTD